MGDQGRVGGGVNKWLFESVHRVPKITDAQIEKMRHIVPVLQDEGCMYRAIRDIEKIHPRDSSFLWDAKPTGRPFTFESLNITTIITQHHSSVFFKPSLAEVYAWIRVYLREDWSRVRCFCLGEAERVGSSCDFYCKCQIMGGPILMQGKAVRFANGSIGYELVDSGAASIQDFAKEGLVET